MQIIKHFITLLFFTACSFLCAQKVSFLDSETKEPVSFATISFGNGLGTFANAEGEFSFDKRRYADVDSLFVSAIGYQEIHISTENLNPVYLMLPDISQLQEVVLSIPQKGKFKRHEKKPVTHSGYFQSWLPTVESEVAVLFNRVNEKATQITSLLLPVNTKEEFQGKSAGSRPFSTMLRVQFYENNENLPGKEIPYGTLVFVLTEKYNKEIFELDVTDYNIFIPENGLFVSVQVLGTTDAEGNLMETKKYNEIETKAGIRKISVTFRPLLPFTNKIEGEQTYVRRIFFNDKKWQKFNFEYNPNSDLLRKGYNNYGMGAKMRVYE